VPNLPIKNSLESSSRGPTVGQGVETEVREVADSRRVDAAYEGKTVKQFLIDLARARLAEMERKGTRARRKGKPRSPA